MQTLETQKTRQTEISLIKGEFTVEEAQEILHNMLYDKITFHARRAHSLQERFGIDTSQIDRRCKELEEIKRNLNKTIKDVAKGNKRLKITGNIQIEVLEDNNQ